ncbi:PIN domain-containing protein [Alicyclobacillus ferrooxydans]|uniref:PIN domain-containing protein n=1 Tax=Alicyclobacillus ferrooxydans TaxID=471514 RepID=A0A0N8PPW1_9BACL|nr:PIN domain-containing protein [Alicyclobacillus ferrooxydans]KPV45429.1 hypothetical protein AN477_02100 [Alicyclobacillus ferrooxydans]
MSNLIVFFDADVLVAGSASTTGAAHLLLTLSELGIIQGMTSAHVQEEARRNLAKKIPDALPEFEEIVQRAVTVDFSPTDTNPFQNFAHPKDVHVLAAAVATHARWLVTFNLKDFYQPPQITVLNPGQAIRTIRDTLGGPASKMT